MTGTLVAVAVAAVAAVAAFFLFRSLSALKSSTAGEIAGLREEAARLGEEKSRLERDLEDATKARAALREIVAELEEKVASTEEQLRTATAERDSLADKARREQTTQRFFFARKAREAFETLKQRLAADGFPDRLEELAGDHPKTLTEEARKILKDVESWADLLKFIQNIRFHMNKVLNSF